jgi:hypothetical protein
MRTSERGQYHGPPVASGYSHHETQGDIHLSRSPLLKHDQFLDTDRRRARHWRTGFFGDLEKFRALESLALTK